MKIEQDYSFPFISEQVSKQLQLKLSKGIDLTNHFLLKGTKLVAGIDLAYWREGKLEKAVCSVVVIQYDTFKIIEKTFAFDTITVPYIPSYLSFRELPLILKTIQQLNCSPDLYMFDGNGYLHVRNMGIATHASFYLDKPTIGVAKNYYKIGEFEFTMPSEKAGSFSDIVINNRIYGRAVRSHSHAKPIFVSCGNYIDLDTATAITIHFIQKESRIPLPTRLADIETHSLRKKLQTSLPLQL